MDSSGNGLNPKDFHLYVKVPCSRYKGSKSPLYSSQSTFLKTSGCLLQLFPKSEKKKKNPDDVIREVFLELHPHKELKIRIMRSAASNITLFSCYLTLPFASPPTLSNYKTTALFRPMGISDLFLKSDL